MLSQLVTASRSCWVFGVMVAVAVILSLKRLAVDLSHAFSLGLHGVAIAVDGTITLGGRAATLALIYQDVNRARRGRLFRPLCAWLCCSRWPVWR